MKKQTSTIVFLLLVLFVSAKNYKAAEIYSNQSYLYGRFEMKIKAAPGSGQLSTFFLYRNESELNTTLWQEIDIEIFGKQTNTFQSNVIIEKVEGTRLQTPVVHTTIPSLSDDFHTYVLEWTPDSITWYLDDVLLRTEKVNALFCNAAMSIRFNHWATNLTSWAGTFDTSVLPQYQYVDYISYASYTPGTGDNGSDFSFQWKDEFTTFDNSRWSKANWTFGENVCDFLPANAYTENDQLVLKIHDVTPIIPNSIDDISSDVISVYPNPFINSISIQNKTDEDYAISLTSLDGKNILPALPLNANTVAEINKALEKQPSGTCILFIWHDGQIVETKKITKL